ncbi:AAA family ATPase [Streptomyces sp. NPDC006660]|uniref:helix-turn-helix transcriptional regulator n=1 Tax=Streptomyces sp. NPDC006660 TaxID=3156901 RepID=UPI0033C11398
MRLDLVSWVRARWGWEEWPVVGAVGGAADRLVGRDEPTAVIEGALAEVQRGGTAVLLRGDPGMGKTALLDTGEEAARRIGLRVLRMTGAPTESGLPFAALHQVLWPVLDEVQDLAESQREPLERALGVRDGVPPEGFAVAGATLALLAHAATRRPVVLLLDDLQWADPSSIAVFGYLRRHLAPLPLVLIGTTRESAADGLPGRMVGLEPLNDREAEQLLRTLHPWLPATARGRVLRAAGGNPLALHELPAQLRSVAPDHPAFRADSPTTDAVAGPFGGLPLGTRLGGLYEDRVRALPDGIQYLLLVAALGGAYGQRLSVLRELAGQRTEMRWAKVLEHIRDSGLAHPDTAEGSLVFRHPLVRAGLVHMASPAERRAGHRLLADDMPATHPQRIIHLAASAVGIDAALASLLHAKADSMAAQGGDAEAADMMARAAGLSPDSGTRAARLVAAAVMAAAGGRLGRSAELVSAAEAEARPGRPEPAAAYAFAVAYTRLQLDGDPTPSIELLPGALDLLAPPAGRHERPGLLEAVFFLLVVVAVHCGDERAWAAVERHATAVSGPALVCLRAWSGSSRTGPDAFDMSARLRETVPALPEDRETPAAWFLLWAAAGLDAVGEYDALVAPFARRHTFATQDFIDALRAHDAFLCGRWEETLALSRRGADTSASHGHAFNQMLFLLNAGQVHAARGHDGSLTALESALSAHAGARHLRAITERLHGLQLLRALGQGRADEAWRLARSLAAPGVVPPRAPWFHLTLVDWVQAAVESGHSKDARRHLRAVRAAGGAPASAHHAFLMTVADALAATDEEAEARFAAVYATPGAEQWPFPLARARLAHGVRLRRSSPGRHAPTAAMAHLRSAYAVFTRLEAAPWARRASRELDPTVEAAECVEGSEAFHPLLSAQELRVAEYASRGLTNRQIGDLLGLSPRTVGSHLYKAFPKLGVTTRAGVARALEETRNARPTGPRGRQGRPGGGGRP